MVLGDLKKGDRFRFVDVDYFLDVYVATEESVPGYPQSTFIHTLDKKPVGDNGSGFWKSRPVEMVLESFVFEMEVVSVDQKNAVTTLYTPANPDRDEHAVTMFWEYSEDLVDNIADKIGSKFRVTMEEIRD